MKPELEAAIEKHKAAQEAYIKSMLGVSDDHVATLFKQGKGKEFTDRLKKSQAAAQVAKMKLVESGELVDSLLKPKTKKSTLSDALKAKIRAELEKRNQKEEDEKIERDDGTPGTVTELQHDLDNTKRLADKIKNTLINHVLLVQKLKRQGSPHEVAAVTNDILLIKKSYTARIARIEKLEKQIANRTGQPSKLSEDHKAKIRDAVEKKLKQKPATAAPPLAATVKKGGPDYAPDQSKAFYTRFNTHARKMGFSGNAVVSGKLTKKYMAWIK